MNRGICLLLTAVVLCAFAAHGQSVDPVMGNWEGKFVKGNAPISAQIIALGKAPGRDEYKAVVSFGEPAVKLDVMGNMKDGKAVFAAEQELNGQKVKIDMTATGEKIAGKLKAKNGGKFTMERVFKKPPTLGEKPPADAVVLFDGKNFDAWQPTKWALVDGGAMEVVKSGNLVSKQEFGDQKLHVEFRTPFMPLARGQHRGNSGVYIQGRYEIQVLDSFGLAPRDNECGGIYRKATPKVIASLPPTEWQTYDVTFHAPQFDGAKKVKNASITVVQNGITILDNVTLDGTTPGGVSGDEAKVGPLLLQDHNGDKVQYRNVWIEPLK